MEEATRKYYIGNKRWGGGVRGGTKRSESKGGQGGRTTDRSNKRKMTVSIKRIRKKQRKRRRSGGCVKTKERPNWS